MSPTWVTVYMVPTCLKTWSPFTTRIITGTEIPSFHWSVSQDTIFAEVDPDSDYQISLWEAVNTEGRDFRSYVIGEEAWRREDPGNQTKWPL